MRSLLQGSEAREKVASLLAAFLENGGQMAQVTIAELEELKAAKESPELYPDLLVRSRAVTVRRSSSFPISRRMI